MYYNINYCILNTQFSLIHKNNIKFNINNKEDFIFYYNNNKWSIYPYYISGIFLTNEPKELIPYIRWKIINISSKRYLE